jgi:hypothetical protein
MRRAVSELSLLDQGFIEIACPLTIPITLTPSSCHCCSLGLSRPNTSGSTWKNPKLVFLWSDFKQSVVSWIDGHHQQHSQRVQKPVFVPRVITEEVQSLQPFILDNLLDVSAKCFIPPSEFKARRQITSCVREPDHLMTRNGEFVAIVKE